MQEIDKLLAAQRAFFRSGATLSLTFREAMLRKLYGALVKYEASVACALRADLGKSVYESYRCEIGLARSEIRYQLRHLRRFAARKPVRTPLSLLPARSVTMPSPYGNTLIVSPWNYPLLLTLEPLAAAIAAGNTAIVKPSAYAPESSALLARMLRETFPEKYVAVVTGGRQENAALFRQKFDLIFFTGSQAVGREVLRQAAEHLTPAVLELGGKSPCIVDETADIELAARRIVFGKFLNCGQTCVAPDYVLCDKRVEPALVQAICRQIRVQFGQEPLRNPNYGKIVNRKHFFRLCALLDPEKTVCGGQTEALRIAPTVLRGVGWDDAVMQEEIFGPILPILTYERFDTLYPLLAKKPKPLALYLFSEDRRRVRTALARFSFGGGCVNDTILHLATSEMGFGGVGESGMGAYHGRAGFEAFSHEKSIVEQTTRLDLPFRYQPYQEKYERLVRRILK